MKRFAIQATVNVWVLGPEDWTDEKVNDQIDWDVNERTVKITLKGRKLRFENEHPSQDVSIDDCYEDGGICDNCSCELDENGNCSDCEDACACGADLDVNGKCDNAECDNYHGNNCDICGEELDDGVCASCTGGTDDIDTELF